MTFDEIDVRVPAALPAVGSGGEAWDDPETPSEDGGDDEPGHRAADEEGTYDESGDQREDDE